MYFWPAKTRKNPKLLEMFTCHWVGAQMWFRQKRRKLVTASLLLHCFDGYSCLRYWNEIIFSLFQVSDWSLLVVHIDVNACNWIPKVIWRRLVFLEYYIRICLVSSTSYLNGLKYGRDAHLIFFFYDIKFCRCLVWDVFWSVLQKFL